MYSVKIDLINYTSRKSKISTQNSWAKKKNFIRYSIEVIRNILNNSTDVDILN